MLRAGKGLGGVEGRSTLKPMNSSAETHQRKALPPVTHSMMCCQLPHKAARLCSRSQNASSAVLRRNLLTSAVHGKPPDIKKKVLGLKKKNTRKKRKILIAALTFKSLDISRK